MSHETFSPTRTTKNYTPGKDLDNSGALARKARQWSTMGKKMK